MTIEWRAGPIGVGNKNWQYNRELHIFAVAANTKYFHSAKQHTSTHYRDLFVYVCCLARTQNITTFMQLRHQYDETSCRTEIMLRHRAPFSAMQHYAFVKIALSLSTCSKQVQSWRSKLYSIWAKMNNNVTITSNSIRHRRIRSIQLIYFSYRYI